MRTVSVCAEHECRFVVEESHTHRLFLLVRIVEEEGRARAEAVAHRLHLGGVEGDVWNENGKRRLEKMEKDELDGRID